MILSGAIANSVAVLIGGFIGIFLKKGIPDKYSNLIMNGLGLFTIGVGVSFFLKSNNMMVMILSVVIGAVIGEWIDIETKLESFGDKLQKGFKDSNPDGFIEGFMTASLMFCIGSMAIMGALQSGLSNNHEILYAKAVMDGIVSLLLGSALGIGVAASSIPLFFYQGGITLLASFVAPYIENAVIDEMTGVGGVLLIGLALVVLDIKKIKLSNLIPALFLPIIIMLFI